MYRKEGNSQWCLAFMDDGEGAGTVLGAAWMLHHEVIFDIAEKRVGIVAAECPEFRKRPSVEGQTALAAGAIMALEGSLFRSKHFSENPLTDSLLVLLSVCICFVLCYRRCSKGKAVASTSGLEESNKRLGPSRIGAQSDDEELQGLTAPSPEQGSSPRDARDVLTRAAAALDALGLSDDDKADPEAPDPMRQDRELRDWVAVDRQADDAAN